MNLPRSLRYERFLIILIYTIEFLYALAVQYRFLIWILFGSYVDICVIYFPTPCNIFPTTPVSTY